MFSFILYDANNLFGRVVITHFYFYYFYKLLYFLKCNYLTLLFVLSIVSLWISSLLRRRKTKFQNGGAILYMFTVCRTARATKRVPGDQPDSGRAGRRMSPRLQEMAVRNKSHIITKPPKYCFFCVNYSN